MRDDCSKDEGTLCHKTEDCISFTLNIKDEIER